MRFTLGMMGPVHVADFREYLDASAWRPGLPDGLGGSPVNLLCLELLRRGQKLIIFTLDPSVRDEVVLEGENLRLCIGPFRAERARDFFSEERRYLLRALLRERPDVLHAQWTYEYALAAQSSGLPHVITAHDAPINVLRRNFIPYRVARTVMAYRAVSRADRIISVSPYVAAHLRRFLLYRGPRDVIPNGLPDKLFGLETKARCPGYPVTYATILNGWNGLKNGRAALEAFARVRSVRTADRLMMFGAGHGPDEAAATWARKHHVADAVEFVGSLAHGRLLEILAGQVDILVHPSLEESQGMVLLEAMAAGIPVIGGRRSGGVPWTLDDGRAGLLVDATSSKAISAAMLELAADPNARKRWGRAGRAHAARRFHIGAVADAYEETYSELLERP